MTVERLQKDFFNAYAALYREVARERGSLKLARLLLDGMIFLYFIQERGWLGGQSDYLYSRFKQCYRDDPQGRSFYTDVLCPLEGMIYQSNGEQLCPSPFDVNNTIFKTVFEALLERFNFTIAEAAPPESEAAIDAEMLGTVFEGLILPSEKDPDKKTRKLTGSYYTPRAVVHFMCRESLKEYLASRLEGESKTDAARARVAALFALPRANRFADRDIKKLRELFTLGEAKVLRQAALDCRVCDPAVGAGAFLLGMLGEIAWAVARLDVRISGTAAIKRRNYDYDLKKQIIESCLYGADIQEEAARLCEMRLWLSMVSDYQAHNDKTPVRLPRLFFHIARGNSLKDPTFNRRADFAEVFDERGGFDVVIGNPPYVNMVEMQSSPDRWDRDQLRQVYATARGGFDLYVPFCELSLKILRPGGTMNLITPNKILSAEYAAALRRQLSKEATVVSLTDLAHSKIFTAAVYPVAALLRKSSPPRNINVYRGARRNGSIDINLAATVAHDLFDRLPGHNWSVLLHAAFELLLPSLSLEQTFASVATVRGAATVAEAYEIKKFLQDGPSTDVRGRFLVSGNIDRYSNNWGSRRTRYIKELYSHPVLPESDMSGTRLREMRLPKVIISGMAKRPKSYFDVEGRYAAAKSTVIIYDSEVELAFLCGLLNSSLYMLLYHALFETLSLGGGYMRFGPPQISRLPLIIPDDERIKRVAGAVEELQKAISSDRNDEARNLDARINREVLEIYNIDRAAFRKVFLQTFGFEPDDYPL